MIFHVRIAELSVDVVHRGARHGMGYGRLESHLVAYDLEILSAIVRAYSSVRLIEDRCHGLVLKRKAYVNLLGMPYHRFLEEKRRP